MKGSRYRAETHTKRQSTQHGYLSSLLGDEETEIEIVYGGKNSLYCADWSGAAKAGQKPLIRQDKNNEPTKEGPPSFVLLESPFTSVSTVSRGHPSLVSLVLR
jgi:hypothetical protein